MNTTQKLYIIAGEASGDLHGSNLIAAIKRFYPSTQIRCWGGDKMQQAGGDLVKHYKETAIMGFVEVIRNLRFIRNLFRFCKEDILTFQPDALILIDYPGFNLRIAKFAKQHNIKVFYYIAPKVWAWKESRVKLLKRYVDKLFVIFPFEVEYFKKHGIDAFYVGNPLTEELATKEYQEERLQKELLDENDHRPIIAILPGSRKQEIKAVLPRLLPVIHRFPDYQFVVTKMPSVPSDVYDKILTGQPVKCVSDLTLELLRHSKAALVTSGTATLETALLNVPQVVCYYGNPLSIFVAKLLVKLPYFSLVNIILKETAVKELLQNDLTEESVSHELSDLLYNVKKIDAIRQKYVILMNLLSGNKISEQIVFEMMRVM